MIMLACAPLAAQNTDPDDDLRAAIARMQAELASLRERMAEQERESADRQLRERGLISIYGDIGLRYHMLFEGQTETFNRPEFRLHLGIFGTPFQQDAQRLRYDMRLTTVAEDPNGKPVPTLSWLPFPGFGANPQLALDRFMFEYDLNRVFTATAGRFPSPFEGSEALFDYDYHFQGLGQTLRMERLFGPAFQRYVPRLTLAGVQGYMAQNNIGLPSPTAETQPVYLGAQFQLALAPFERVERAPDGSVLPGISSEMEFRLTAGIHWFDGEEAIATNLGLGYLEDTTNLLDDDGLVQSEFLVGEVLAEVVLLRSRRARVLAWFHGLINFHSEAQQPGRGERNDQAFEAGASWGMDRLTQRWDFLIAFRYFLIEADAVIPEFNSDLWNTNIKGWQADLHVNVFPSMTAFGSLMVTERENFELNGFGLPNRDKPSRASGQSMRIRVGLYLEF